MGRPTLGLCRSGGNVRCDEALLFRTWCGCVQSDIRASYLVPVDRQQCSWHQHPAWHFVYPLTVRGVEVPASTPLLMARLKVGGTLVLAVSAIGCGQQHGPPLQHSVTSHTPTPKHRVRQAFGTMRGPSASLPPSLRSHLTQILRRDRGSQLRASLVHQAHTSRGVAWVFLDGTAVCLAEDTNGSVACSSLAQAESEGVSLGVFSPPSKQVPKPHDFLLMGLAPDGVDRVAITIRYRHQVIDVQNNIYSASADRPIVIRQLVRGTS